MKFTVILSVMWLKQRFLGLWDSCVDRQIHFLELVLRSKILEMLLTVFLHEWEEIFLSNGRLKLPGKLSSCLAVQAEPRAPLTAFSHTSHCCLPSLPVKSTFSKLSNKGNVTFGRLWKGYRWCEGVIYVLCLASSFPVCFSVETIQRHPLNPQSCDFQGGFSGTWHNPFPPGSSGRLTWVAGTLLPTKFSHQ